MRVALALLLTCACEPAPADATEPEPTPLSVEACDEPLVLDEEPVAVLASAVVYCAAPAVQYNAVDVEVYASGVIVFDAGGGLLVVLTGDCVVEE